jgi:hypothetical protein
VTPGEKPTDPPAADRPYTVRLPGFLLDEDVGLGDLLKRTTYRLGVRPCDGCARRAAALNRRVVIRSNRSFPTRSKG